jgi:transposase
MNATSGAPPQSQAAAQLPFTDIAPLPGRFVNPRCIIHEQDGLRVAVVDGSATLTWPVEDVVAENLAVVQLRQLQVATIEELALALGRGERTLYRALDRYAKEGAAGVAPKRAGRPAGSGRDVLRDVAIRRMHAAGLLNYVIAQRLKASPVTVARALERMGLSPNRARQQRLAGSSEAAPPAGPPQETTGGVQPTDPLPHPPAAEGAPIAAEAEPVETPSLDANPLDRSLDRFLASQGELTDAAPLFASGQSVPWAGALLAIPGLVQSGLLTEARRLYGDIGPAFYGLRTSLVAVVLLSLLRLKRPEHLKEFAPPELGRVLGLDRAPEVKTLRRKLHRLAEGPSDALLLAVAQRRARAHEEALGWLYVDGHVRVYSGKERLPMAHVTRMRISMPATQDMWVHDGDGRPILFVTQEAHPSLATALPPLLEAAREVVGDRRRVTVVFDRGGWSPKLFAELADSGADVLTYRKGPSDPLPATWFEPRRGRPTEPDWLLHDQCVRLPNGLWMRQITRLVGEHQTAIVTTRQDLDASDLARRMFDRWRQENFFKYMRQEFDLDGLCEYGAEDEDPLRETPNPERTRRDKALRKARQAWQATLARHDDRAHPAVSAAAARVDELRRQRDAVPRRVHVGELETPPVTLPARVKNLYDGLKTLAWQCETDLVHAVTPFYGRAEDEGRTLIAAAVRSRGDLDVSEDALTLTLAPQSSPHRTRAIAHLCRLLDATETRFPGTRLRLRYRVAGDPLDPPVPTA